VAQALRDARVATPMRDFGIPLRFLDHAKRSEVMAEIGLTAQDIARDIVETVSGLEGRLEQSVSD
jgi:1-deoxy-D-xylulose-5-phosphate synthase